MSIGIISIITFVVWFLAIQEFAKPEKNQSNRKIITLTSTGSLLTLVLSISLFHNLQNLNF
nr:hypothetical protein [Alkalihalobacterium bogoriense]